MQQITKTKPINQKRKDTIFVFLKGMKESKMCLKSRFLRDKMETLNSKKTLLQSNFSSHQHTKP